MDPHYLYIFLFTELGEINGIYISNIIQVKIYLVLQYYSWAGTALSAQGGGNKAAALYSIYGRQV